MNTPLSRDQLKATGQALGLMAGDIVRTLEADLKLLGPDDWDKKEKIVLRISEAAEVGFHAQGGRLHAALKSLLKADPTKSTQLKQVPGLTQAPDGTSYLPSDVVTTELEREFGHEATTSLRRSKAWAALTPEKQEEFQNDRGADWENVFGPLRHEYVVGTQAMRNGEQHFHSIYRLLPEESEDATVVSRIYFESLEEQIEGGSVNPHTVQNEVDFRDHKTVREAVESIYRTLGYEVATPTPSAPVAPPNLDDLEKELTRPIQRRENNGPQANTM